jgi:Anthrone oxygenase
LDILSFVTLVVVGFTACAEFGSYAFVHPVIRRLPSRHHIEVEQGLLQTFGKVMPVLMTSSVVLALAHASHSTGPGGPAGWRWMGAASMTDALISTLVFNVPVNLATRRWVPERPPEDWKETRDRWELFQGLRSWLLLLGFVCLCVGFACSC